MHDLVAIARSILDGKVDVLVGSKRMVEGCNKLISHSDTFTASPPNDMILFEKCAAELVGLPVPSNWQSNNSVPLP